jgi:hypothetical protein
MPQHEAGFIAELKATIEATVRELSAEITDKGEFLHDSTLREKNGQVNAYTHVLSLIGNADKPDSVKSEPVSVKVLTISHKHGTDVTVHRNEASARKALYDFAVEWWDGQDPLPSTPAAAVNAYFSLNEDESWEIDSTLLIGDAEPATDSVALSEGREARADLALAFQNGDDDEALDAAGRLLTAFDALHPDN